MSVLLVTNDLLAASRVEGAALRAGKSLRTLSSPDALSAEFDTAPPRLVLVDLNTPEIDVREIVRAAKCAGRSGPKIIAFGPHVHESRLAAARDAQCDVVVSRGQFFAQIDMLLGDSAIGERAVGEH
jgi:DNA-binding response OmpR family regulator